jgi:2-oxoisovalerate dehydrogenase E2 component (dihydrolipoyl transacylase)
LTNVIPYLHSSSSASSPSKPNYIASDIPTNLARDPLSDEISISKPTLLVYLIKAMILALEEHPIMRSRLKFSGEDRWLEVSRDPIIGVAVSGLSHFPHQSQYPLTLRTDPTHGLVTPSLPPLTPTTSLSEITSLLNTIRQNPTKPSSHPSPSITISSVGNLGESTGAMPVIPPGGGLAICAVGRAKWEPEYVMRDRGLKVSQRDVERSGIVPVLRCPVGWSGDHRAVSGVG